MIDENVPTVASHMILEDIEVVSCSSPNGPLLVSDRSSALVDPQWNTTSDTQHPSLIPESCGQF